MKDKVAAKLKKRRKEERSRWLERQKDNFMQSFNNHLETRGLQKKYDRELVWKAQKILRKKMQEKSRIYCLYTTMYCLHKLYGWSRDRLIKYCNEVLWIIQAVVNGDRTIEKLADELLVEVKLDIPAMFKEETGTFNKDVSEKRMETDVVLAEMPCDMIVCIYAIYHYRGFREKRIKRIAEAVRKEVEDALMNDRLPEIQAHLRKCGIKAGNDFKIEVIEKAG